MPRYIEPSSRVLNLARTIDKCFELVTAPYCPAQQGIQSQAVEAKPSIDFILEAPWSVVSSASLRIGGDYVLLETDLPRSPQRRLRCRVPERIDGPLRLRLELGDRTYNFETKLVLSDGSHSLRVWQWAEDAPPRVYLDDVEINRGPGARFRKVCELPSHTKRRHDVFLMQDGLTVLDRPEPVRVYIDDVRVERRQSFVVDRTRPVYHRAKLPLGLHRIVVVSARRGWVLIDTDIIVNGVDKPRIVWSRPNLSDAAVVVRAGAREFFRGSRGDTGFFEGFATLGPRRERVVIDGIDVPEGIQEFEKELRRAKEFSEAMIANYRAFLERKRAVNEKKTRGEALTEEERKIDAIDTYGEMQDWVVARKRAEGYSPQEGGKTPPCGEPEDVTPPAEDPYEELQKKITMKVHEPSHVEGNKRRAAAEGLNWEKLQKFFKALDRVRALEDTGKTDVDIDAELTQEEKDALEWGNANLDKIRRYLDAIAEPVAGAEEEIQEYEAEVRFYEELLRKLEEEREKKKHSSVPEKFIKQLVAYYFACREAWKTLSNRDKAEMCENLRALRNQVASSTSLTNAEKADLTRMIDETLDTIR